MGGGESAPHTRDNNVAHAWRDPTTPIGIVHFHTLNSAVHRWASAFSDNNSIGGLNFLYANPPQTHIRRCLAWDILVGRSYLKYSSVSTIPPSRDQTISDFQNFYHVRSLLSFSFCLCLCLCDRCEIWKRRSVKSCVKQPLRAWHCSLISGKK